jgi:hypothetical protein
LPVGFSKKGWCLVSTESTFQFASERLELAVNTVAVIAEGCSADSAFALLYTIQHDRERHSGILYDSIGKLATLSDGAIVWAHGRGRHGVVQCPDVFLPFRWSSAHEAALEVSRLALEYFFWPLELPPDSLVKFEQLSVGQLTLFQSLLDINRRKALALTMDEVADWQERIRRERAKLLMLTTPLTHESAKIKNTADAEQRLRVVVDINCMTIMLDEISYNVSSKQALRWVKVLVEHPGEWISASELHNYDNELMGTSDVPFGRATPVL